MRLWILVAALTIWTACAVSADGLRIIDREVIHLKGPTAGRTPRPTPIPKEMRPSLPRIAPTMEVPYPWKIEKVYAGKNSGYIYTEPGKPWILQLMLLYRGKTDTEEGSATYHLGYVISNDGGKSFGPIKILVQRGSEYNPMHPLNCVWMGKNTFAIGDTPIIRASNGEIMVPIAGGIWGKDGKPFNPLNAYGGVGFAGVLTGRWKKDGSDIEWDLGKVAEIDPYKSSRGLSEPTLVELKKKGHFMMIARGANENLPGKPGYKWVTFSNDYCRTWSALKPFTYSDGKPFYSPAAMAITVRSKKNGRIYWIGNICEKNPDGDYPRDTLLMGEVDEKTHGLIRESLIVLDKRDPLYDCSEKMQLSNFYVYQDKSGNILVDLPRFDFLPGKEGAVEKRAWYLVEVPEK